jgi:hypothetical protein
MSRREDVESVTQNKPEGLEGCRREVGKILWYNCDLKLEEWI